MLSLSKHGAGFFNGLLVAEQVERAREDLAGAGRRAGHLSLPDHSN